jgi:hypothetical protein
MKQQQVDYDALFQTQPTPFNKSKSTLKSHRKRADKVAMLSEEEILLHEHSLDELHHQAEMTISPIGLVMDLLAIVGIHLDSLDYSSKEDQTFMTMLQPHYDGVAHKVYDNLDQLHHFFFRQRQGVCKVIISLKVNPFDAEVGLHNPIPITSKVTRYSSAMQVTFALCSAQQPIEQPALAANSMHAGHINLLREVNYTLRDLSSSSSGDDDKMGGTIVMKDSYRRVWMQAIGEALQGLDMSQQHPVFQASTCIYDLYLGSHMTSLTKHTAISSPRKHSRAQAVSSLLPLVKSFSLTKLYGIYDTSICATLSVVPVRLLLQVLMLLVTSHPSIVLVSSNTTLLMKIQALLPRLLHPFHVDELYHSHCILSTKQLHEVYGIQHRRQQQAATGSQLASPSLSRNHSMNAASSMSMPILLDTSLSSPLPCLRPAALSIPSPQLSCSSIGKTLSVSQQQPEKTRKHRLCFIDARSYHLVRIELLNGHTELLDPALVEQTVAFDLDAAIAMVSPTLCTAMIAVMMIVCGW